MTQKCYLASQLRMSQRVFFQRCYYILKDGPSIQLKVTHRSQLTLKKIISKTDAYEKKSCLVHESFARNRIAFSPIFLSLTRLHHAFMPLLTRKSKLFLKQVNPYTTSSSLNVSRSCWKCGKDTNPKKDLFFCECGVVQSTAPSLTYFDLLQQDPSFELEPKLLGIVFRDTQKLLHPDMFSSKSKKEQQLAEEQSSLLNKAYQTLLKPLSRAIYMLKLQNVTIDEKDTISDPEFLMDIMNINEQIDEAFSATDIDNVEEANSITIDRCIQELAKAFKENDIQGAKRSTIKLRYFTTISERILELRRRELG